MKLLLALALCTAATVLGQGLQGQSGQSSAGGGGGSSGGGGGGQQQQGGQQQGGGGGGGDDSSVNTQAIFKALTIDRCFSPCIKELQESITQSLKFTNLYDNAIKTCDASNQCQKDCVNLKSQPLPQLALSGIQQLCDPQTRQKIKAQQSCIKPVIDQIAQQCDQKTNFAKSVSAFSNSQAVKSGLNPLATLKELGPICQSSPLFFTCLREGLDQKCPQSGAEITHALSKPFYLLAQFVSQRPPQLQELIKKQYLAQQCVPLTDSQTLDKIWQENGQSGGGGGGGSQQQQGGGQQQQQSQGGAQSGGGLQQGQQREEMQSSFGGMQGGGGSSSGGGQQQGGSSGGQQQGGSSGGSSSSGGGQQQSGQQQSNGSSGSGMQSQSSQGSGGSGSSGGGSSGGQQQGGQQQGGQQQGGQQQGGQQQGRQQQTGGSSGGGMQSQGGSSSGGMQSQGQGGSSSGGMQSQGQGGSSSQSGGMQSSGQGQQGQQRAF